MIELILFVVGCCAGGCVNWAIYRLAIINPRPISPWTRLGTSGSQMLDLVPLVGWWNSRRMENKFGRRFWIRPLLIECSCGLGLVLFWHGIRSGILTSCVQFAPQVDSFQAWIWLAYFYPLFLLLLAATFIDFDEKTIPDEITLTGTLIALPLVYAFPQTRLPDVQLQDGAPRIEGLHFASPDALPTWQDGRWGLILSCFVIALWMFALVPKRWTWRYGLVRGLALAWASILRPARRTGSAGSASPRKMHRLTLLAAALGMVLIMMTTGAWSLGGPAWDRLFGAWMGLAFGGGLVWAVRIVAGGTLGKEAMGFGDVTLMGMVGAWLGWQPALLAFAIAPFAALFIAVAQLVFLRHTEIAFGPYLSLGAVVVVARWGPLWHDWARVSVFALGPVLLAIALACLGLMAVLLGGWRWIKERWLVGGTE